MAIDPAVFEAADPAERQQILRHQFSADQTRALTWRYAVMMALSIIPLFGVGFCLEQVAGKTTTISITVTAAIAITGVAGLALKVALQRRELGRLRRRIRTLEQDLGVGPVAES